MAVPHYTYLVLKIPRPNGIITVKGSFKVSDTCDKEFHKMAQTFGMMAEYVRLKGDTDHDILPDIGRSLPATPHRPNNRFYNGLCKNFLLGSGYNRSS
jgi:hypothetical protein